MGELPDDSAWEAARAAHCDAFVAARAADDAGAMAAAALGLASLQRFGGPGGRTPALLHEAYLAADYPATRARLAAALARSWVYGNDAARGAPFALEAVELAEETRDPTVLADALDAQLATSWGPDDLSERLHVTARLQDVAAHVDDVRTRMDAHLWRLTTALETLDVTGMHRQLSALDLLADETGSPLVRYFAMTRRAMHATLVGDLDRAGELAEAAYALGTDIGVADAFAVYHEQRAEIARHADDVGFLAGEAALAEDYAVRHGIESVIAEAAVLALQAGDTERASRLVHAGRRRRLRRGAVRRRLAAHRVKDDRGGGRARLCRHRACGHDADGAVRRSLCRQRRRRRLCRRRRGLPLAGRGRQRRPAGG